MTADIHSVRSGLPALMLAGALLLGALLTGGTPAWALPVAPAAGVDVGLPVEPARSLLRGIFDALGDDDDYVHDDHYDWNDYRNATSRKERVRDYYLMQQEAQKDYWKQQKEMQKKMIKAQRGW